MTGCKECEIGIPSAANVKDQAHLTTPNRPRLKLHQTVLLSTYHTLSSLYFHKVIMAAISSDDGILDVDKKLRAIELKDLEE